jgi:hypothetical protein
VATAEDRLNIHQSRAIDAIFDGACVGGSNAQVINRLLIRISTRHFRSGSRRRLENVWQRIYRGWCRLFYEGKGVITRPALRVWTKCLLRKDLDSINPESELGKKIVESAAQKVVQGYIPPIALVEDMDYDQASDVIGLEETANLSNIQPQARFFYELNCSERMMRRLSTQVRTKGKDRFDDNPSGWEYVAPEGSAARLLKILCR